MIEKATKERILAAAEKLFATKGIAATSLRLIIKEAEVNTAAVHYHFGSKEALLEAVLAQRAAPINEERLQQLKKHENQHPSGTLPLEGIIDAFVAPVIRMRFNPSGKGELFPQLMARVITEANDKIHSIFRNIFGEVFTNFTLAFKRALPNLPEEELLWRMHLLLGAMAFTIAIPGIHTKLKIAHEDQSKVDRIIHQLVAFVAAGMRTPAYEPSRKDH